MAAEKTNYSIRSKYADGHLRLEAVHTKTDTVFHIHEKAVENEREADITTEAYKRFVSEGYNFLPLMTVYLADIFEVDYKGKTMIEAAHLIGLKIKELQEKGE